MKKRSKVFVSGTVALAMVMGTAASALAAGPGAVTSTEVTQHEIDSSKISLQIAEESMVLLKNENNALPIASGGNIALYGLGTIKTVKGGTGSGAVNNRVVYPDGEVIEGTAICSSIQDGFERAGYNIVNKGYLSGVSAAVEGASTNMMSSSMAADPALDEAVVTEDAAQADTAIYTIRRNAGEGSDRTPAQGDWYLTDEELNNLKLLREKFKKVVVLLNVTSIDSSWIEESGVDAVLLVGNPGELSGDAVVENLNGTVTPSGKLVDTWAKDINDYPSTKYFGNINPDDPWGSHVEYYNEGIYVGYRYFDTFASDKVNYEFGYGLSYTTFDISDVTVHADADKVTVTAKVTNTGDTYSGKEVVQVYFSAPAGELDKPYQELAAYGKTDNLAPGQSQTLTLTFNTTDMSSYSEAKAAYVMEQGDYIIRVGDSSRNTTPAGIVSLDQTVITEQLTNQMVYNREGKAAGGATGRGTPPYENVVDITPEENAANLDQLTEEFKESVQNGTAYSDGKDTAAAAAVSVSGADLENTEDTAYPDGSNEDVPVYISATTDEDSLNISGYNYETNTAYNVTPVYFDADGNETSEKPDQLADYSKCTLKDVYDGTITLEQFVSGMSISEMADMVEGGNKSSKPAGQSAGGTSPNTMTISDSVDKAILDNYVPGEAGETAGLYTESRLIPNTTNADGPAGLRVSQSFDEDGTTYYQYCTAYPVGQNIAQTWNTDVAYDMGESIGNDMANAGVDVWLAPGMNIHRNPLCGRNFEYYSEDPLVAGMTAASECKGVQSVPGRGVTFKHFAANNQETDRNNSNSMVSERALREIYLRGFEIAVKSSKPQNIMSSYNEINNVPAANDYELLTNILRKEWGFDGMVMTDWGGSGGYSDARAMHAGNDVIMAGKSVSNITGYIADAAPSITLDENGMATDGGYPFTMSSTVTWGTTVYNSANTMWGDYTLDAEGSDYSVTTTKDLFDGETRPVVVYTHNGAKMLTAVDRSSDTSEFEYWTIRELFDGKDYEDGTHLPGLIDNGTGSYTEDGDTVTLTYKLSKLSDQDNVSTQQAADSSNAGYQKPYSKDILGNDDVNTLTLGDLQKSVINVLRMVITSNNFAKLIDVEPTSYTQDRADSLVDFVSVEKSDIS